MAWRRCVRCRARVGGASDSPRRGARDPSRSFLTSILERRDDCSQLFVPAPIHCTPCQNRRRRGPVRHELPAASAQRGLRVRLAEQRAEVDDHRTRSLRREGGEMSGAGHRDASQMGGCWSVRPRVQPRRRRGGAPGRLRRASNGGWSRVAGVRPRTYPARTATRGPPLDPAQEIHRAGRKGRVEWWRGGGVGERRVAAEMRLCQCVATNPRHFHRRPARDEGLQDLRSRPASSLHCARRPGRLLGCPGCPRMRPRCGTSSSGARPSDSTATSSAQSGPWSAPRAPRSFATSEANSASPWATETGRRASETG